MTTPIQFLGDCTTARTAAAARAKMDQVMRKAFFMPHNFRTATPDHRTSRVREGYVLKP